MKQALRVCFIGGARYSKPLNATSEKKFGALAALGEIFVIGLSPGVRPGRFYQKAHFYLFPQLRPAVLRHLLILILGPVLILWCVLRHGVRILVAQSPYEGAAAGWAKTLARVAGKQVVLIIESHGDFERTVFLQKRAHFPRVYRLIMHRLACSAGRHADVLRAVSIPTSQQLSQRAPQKPIIQFPAWTDIEVFLSHRPKETQHSSQQHSSQQILFAGALTAVKGVHHLINSFALIAPQFPHATLTVAGRVGNKDYAGELKASVQRLKLNERVRFTGEVSQSELAILMQSACVLVLPSLSEGLGRVILEAMAIGTPVIGSHVGGIPELISDGETGLLVPPADENALAERLRWVLTKPQEAGEMGRRGHKFADQYFSTESYVAGYRKIFDTAQSLLDVKEQPDASPAF